MSHQASCNEFLYYVLFELRCVNKKRTNTYGSRRRENVVYVHCKISGRYGNSHEPYTSEAANSFSSSNMDKVQFQKERDTMFRTHVQLMKLYQKKSLGKLILSI